MGTLLWTEKCCVGAVTEHYNPIRLISSVSWDSGQVRARDDCNESIDLGLGSPGKCDARIVAVAHVWPVLLALQRGRFNSHSALLVWCLHIGPSTA